jgi:putative serine protease PepD
MSTTTRPGHDPQPHLNEAGSTGWQQPGGHHESPTQTIPQHAHGATPATPYPTGYPSPHAYSYGAASGQSPQSPTPPQPPTGNGAQQPASQPRKPRTFLTAVTAAVLAAALASGGTAALLNQDTDDGGSAAAQPGDLTQVQGVAASADGTPDWEAAAAAVSPSVVAIDVQVAQGEAAGSGVILDTEGNILTNNHVVEGAEQVSVMLFDGRIYQAQVVGTDPTTDLAVIQIADPPSDLAPASLGTSADLAVGEPVMAVGNPLGLDNTVTTGIISALERPVTASSESSSSTTVTNAIQIDAAINPGNSGGPLFDAQGLVIGITSSIATMSGGGQSGSIGLGFAIPIDLATTIAEQLMSNGVAEHAYLGVTLQEGEGTADGVTRQGAQVVDVAPGTPAESAGLRSGDVVVGIDDHSVGSAESLTGFVRQYSSGDQVTLTVIRDGESIEVPVTLTTREDG